MIAGRRLKLEILTPDRIFFEGLIDSLVINTMHGEMGILAHTLPFVTTLASGTIRILHEGKWMEAVTGEGFVKVRANVVTILADSCEWPYEISADSAREEVDQLTDLLRRKQSLREHKIAKAQLARQLARLKVTTKD